MKDIPEVETARFVTPVAGMGGATLQTRLVANKDLKLAVVSDTLVITRAGKVTCLVPVHNCAYLAPKAQPAPVEAKK